MEWLDKLPIFLVPLAVFMMSVVGSLHCVGMCGPLCVMAGHTSRWNLALYHFGRLMGYGLLGVVAGYFGAQLLKNYHPFLSLAGALTIGLCLIVVGIRFQQGQVEFLKGPRLLNTARQQIWSRWLPTFQKKVWGSFLIGFFTPLLPCGWLYAFILTAVVTQSALWGGLLLVFFWLGTVPALSFLSIIAQKPFLKFRHRQHKLSSCLMIVAGVLVIALRLLPLIGISDDLSKDDTSATIFYCH